ncbi:MAG: hypothetical protein BWY87_01093 [Deltaproteobacteria bacterium ADurb.Bin510]|nr:MAG: hypothetical protein BWY87_01093 [Deltaproteobacteria bacterium ADurb.Bin510]
MAEAYELYRDPASKPGSDSARAFRERYCHAVRIECIGVWDTESGHSSTLERHKAQPGRCAPANLMARLRSNNPLITR